MRHIDSAIRPELALTATKEDPLCLERVDDYAVDAEGSRRAGEIDDGSDPAFFVDDGKLADVNVGRGKIKPRYRFAETDIDDFEEKPRVRKEPSCRFSSRKSRDRTTGRFPNRRPSVSWLHGLHKSQRSRKVEQQEREWAKVRVKAGRPSAVSLRIDHVSRRFWDEVGQQHAGQGANDAMPIPGQQR